MHLPKALLVFSLHTLLAFLIGPVATADPLAEALGQPTLTASSSGALPWTVEREFLPEANTILKSGEVATGEQSVVELSVAGPGTVSFWWKTDSDSTDSLTFSIDGTIQGSPISSVTDWEQKSYLLTAGAHTLRWTYHENEPIPDGPVTDDRAYLRNLEIPVQGSPTIQSQPTSHTIFARTGAAFSVVASGGALSYQWYQGTTGDLTNPISGANGPLLVTAPLYQNTDCWVQVSNAAGSIDSATATATVDDTGGSLIAFNTPPYLLGSTPEREEIAASGIVVSATSGSTHYYIKDNQTLWGWGTGAQGQLGTGDYSNHPLPIQIATNVLQVYPGSLHTLYLKTDYSLWAMGSNSNGQLGDGTNDSRPSPVKIADNVIAAAAGNFHSLFVTDDGLLWSTGYNRSGQLGNANLVDQNTPVSVASNVAQLSAGLDHSVFVKQNGELWGMGHSWGYGRPSDHPILDPSIPAQVGSRVIRSASGDDHAHYITDDTTIWAVGENSRGELGDGTDDDQRTPVFIDTGGVSLAAGENHSHFIKNDGSLWFTGTRFANESPSTETPLLEMTGVRSAAAADRVSLWIELGPKIDSHPEDLGAALNTTANFSVYASGLGVLSYQWYQGQSGDTSTPIPGGVSASFTSPPVTASVLYWVRVTNAYGSVDSTSAEAILVEPPIITTQPHSIAAPELRGWAFELVATGNLLSYQWFEGAVGDTSKPLLGAEGPMLVVPPRGAATNFWVRVTNFEGSIDSAIAVTGTPLPVPQSGHLLGMGSINGTSLGPTPTEIDPGGVIWAATQGHHLLILRDDHTLWGLGSNSKGQLGDGSTITATEPVLISSGVQTASVGSSHSLFLKLDGSLWAMGANSKGQVGDGTGSDSVLLPYEITSGVVAISSYQNHSLFLKEDGTLWGMGEANSDVLGPGGAAPVLSPLQIASGVSGMATTDVRTLVISFSGTLWDLPSYSGTTPDLPVPLAEGCVTVKAEPGTPYHHTLFLKPDASLWGFGYNSAGQLGIPGNGSTPQQIATNVVSMATGHNHSLFVTSNNRLWGMGLNWANSLGPIGSGFHPTPVEIAQGVNSVWGGAGTLFVDLNPSIRTEPQDTPAVLGASVNLQVEAEGASPLTYQWYEGESGDLTSPVAGGTTSTFATPVITESAKFWVRVTNSFSSVDSSAAEVIYVAPPVINTQPSPSPAPGGDLSRLTVDASGELLEFQWFQGNSGDESTPVTGANKPLFLVPRYLDGQNFWVRVSNPAGQLNSVTVTVSFPERSPLQAKGVGKNSSFQLGKQGSGGFSPSEEPSPVDVLDDVIDSATGSTHTLFVTADQELWGVGSNTYGQLSHSTDPNPSSREVPEKLAEDVQAIAAGYRHSLFVKLDGSLWAMGDNASGQLGDGTETRRTSPVAIDTNVVGVWTHGYFSVYLKDDGTLWGMGSNSAGQLGGSVVHESTVPVLIASHVVTASTGHAHVLFLTSDGSLWAMGDNGSGQLGDGTYDHRSIPTLIASGVIDVSAGNEHSLYLTTDGSLWTMGAHIIFVSGGADPTIPMLVSSNVLEISAGGTHSHFVKDDFSLWAFGTNEDGQIGNGFTSFRNPVSTPIEVQPAATIVRGGLSHTIFLDPSPGVTMASTEVDTAFGGTGELTAIPKGLGPFTFQWYLGNSGDLSHPISGANNATLTTDPINSETFYWVQVTNPVGSADSDSVRVLPVAPPTLISPLTNKSIEEGNSTFLEVAASGESLRYQWFSGAVGDTSNLIPGADGPLFVSTRLYASGLKWVRVSNAAGAVDAGGSITVLPRSRMRVLATGRNTDGQLGDGTTTNRNTPVTVAGNVVSFSAGYTHSLLIKDDGSLWSFGNNDYGQLGDGTLESRLEPTEIAQNVVYCSAGFDHSLFIKDDGTLWSFGRNSFGELGNGTNLSSSTPIQIATNVTDCAAGTQATAFVKADGTLWTTGFNIFGQLGTGNNQSQSTPVNVAENVARVDLNGASCVFLTASGNMMGMGQNLSGILGNLPADLTFQGVSSPGQISAHISNLASGESHNLQVRPDRTAWGIGNNFFGQLGETPGNSNPDPVFILNEVTSASAGYYTSFFHRTDGTLWAMGSNEDGQLGLGETLEVSTPTLLQDSAHAVSGGHYHTLIGDLAPAIIDGPQTLAESPGQSIILSVTVVGSAPISYQWYSGSSGNTTTPITGATSDSLTISVEPGTNEYWVQVTDARGVANSTTASVFGIVGSPAYFAWASAAGLDPQDLLHTSDPDHDQIHTLLEFLLDRNPLAIEQTPLLSFQHNPSVNQSDLLLSLREAESGLVAALHISTDLKTWEVAGLDFRDGQWFVGGDSLTLVSATPQADQMWDLQLRRTGSPKLFVRFSAGWLAEDQVGSAAYREWAVAQGLAGLDLGTAADPNHNGRTNFLEFSLNADPLNNRPGDGPTGELSDIESAPALSMTHRRHLGTGLIYRYQWSPDLSLWSDFIPVETVLDTDIDNDGSTELVRMSRAMGSEESTGFLRMIVSDP